MRLRLLPIALLLTGAAGAQPAPTVWTVDGIRREAIVIPPAKPAGGPAPVLFVFHGHGGTMRNVARKGFQAAWPEAIVVCPQGLPTVTGLDPEGRLPGWQLRLGADGDRDLKFFDAMLATLREKFNADPRRVFVTGHSNGGRFTYLLAATRREQLAAVAPSSCPAAGLGVAEPRPLPVLHLAGKTDRVVPYDAQARTMDGIRRLNGCAPEGKPWASAGDLTGTIYSCQSGAPFVSLIHPGGHLYPNEAVALIVRFFQEAKTPKFARAAREFECAFHAHLLAGSGDLALEGTPVAVAVGALVAPIALLRTVAIDQIACAPVGDPRPVPQRIGRFLGPFHFDKRKGTVAVVVKH
jgi:polyhydroxybutyrate depolymerase